MVQKSALITNFPTLIFSMGKIVVWDLPEGLRQKITENKMVRGNELKQLKAIVKERERANVTHKKRQFISKTSCSPVPVYLEN